MFQGGREERIADCGIGIAEWESFLPQRRQGRQGEEGILNFGWGAWASRPLLRKMEEFEPQMKRSKSRVGRGRLAAPTFPPNGGAVVAQKRREEKRKMSESRVGRLRRGRGWWFQGRPLLVALRGFLKQLCH